MITLHEQEFSSASKTAIYGKSAGGLPIGVMLNTCPKLFSAVVLEVCINKLRFPSLTIEIENRVLFALLLVEIFYLVSYANHDMICTSSMAKEHCNSY